VTDLEARGRQVFRDEAAMSDQWTAERVSLLRHLWASGASASAIAAQLGGLSRSAVLGKIYRLRRTVADPAVALKPRPPADHPPQADESAQPVSPASEQRGKGLLELTNNCCRWPIGRRGQSEIFFCGVPEADLARGMPYCLRHARRGYVIPPAAYLMQITPAVRTGPTAEPADAAPAEESRSRRRRDVWRAVVRHPAPRFR
jgi:GcrA cell cycle regulator